MDEAYRALQLPMHSGHQAYHKSQIMLPQAKYRRRFFSREEYANPEMSVCPCRQAPLETHEHVIFEHTRYNGVVGDTLDDIIDFLEEILMLFASRQHMLVSLSK